MKVAIVHDYIKEQGGAELVLEELIKIFPQADVYTSIYAPEYLGPHTKRFENIDIKTSFLNKIPFRHKLISPLRLLSPFAFKSFDLRRYDVVIVSQTGAYFPNLVKHTKGKLICYTHTPPRYLYGYKTARDISKSPLLKIGSAIAFHLLRMVDFEASKNVDQFIANSEEVRGRIEKFYRRDAVVIYPPVKIPNVVKGKKEDFYLAGGRLARAKGIDVIVRAFIKNGKKLKIFGKGFAGFDTELRRMAGIYSSNEVRSSNGKSSLPQNAGSNDIEFLGEVSDEEKFELMARSKAFIFASYDEDFGIMPVESMGVGTPVIAYRSGGVKETVVEGKTGVFYDKNTPNALNQAIEKFESLRQAQGRQARDDISDNCVKQAEKFSTEEFDRKITKLVSSL